MANLQNTDFEDTRNVWETLRNQLQMRADVEAGIRELDDNQGIPQDEIFGKLLKEFA